MSVAVAHQFAIGSYGWYVHTYADLDELKGSYSAAHCSACMPYIVITLHMYMGKGIRDMAIYHSHIP